jgi:hypothetical protein
MVGSGNGGEEVGGECRRLDWVACPLCGGI